MRARYGACFRDSDQSKTCVRKTNFAAIPAQD